MRFYYLIYLPLKSFPPLLSKQYAQNLYHNAKKHIEKCTMIIQKHRKLQYVVRPRVHYLTKSL